MTYKLPIIYDWENNLTTKEQCCYFCGYTKTLDRHHIVSKKFIPFDENLNFIKMCPSCHALLHRHIFELRYIVKEKIFYLYGSDEKIYPISKFSKRERPSQIYGKVNKDQYPNQKEIPRYFTRDNSVEAFPVPDNY